NFANRKKPSCEKGSPVNCARTVATDALKKKLKEKMLVTSRQGLGVGGGTFCGASLNLNKALIPVIPRSSLA
ncbi:hypothetical protein Droror1_Dr00027779, partial [Drosera rotundifolia]